MIAPSASLLYRWNHVQFSPDSTEVIQFVHPISAACPLSESPAARSLLASPALPPPDRQGELMHASELHSFSQLDQTSGWHLTPHTSSLMVPTRRAPLSLWHWALGSAQTGIQRCGDKTHYREETMAQGHYRNILYSFFFLIWSIRKPLGLPAL